MKNIVYLIIFCLAFTGCQDQLEKDPNFISETVVFESEDLTEAYISNLYGKSKFQNGSNQDMGLVSAMGSEYIAFGPWQLPNQAVRRAYTQDTGPGPLDRWNFKNIRDMNYLLENISNSENLDPDYIALKKAEVRFLRAYDYFEMVKRFGGVPIIDKLQFQEDSNEELFVPRNTEQEVYDFIYNEIQDIVNVFNDNKTGAKGRADKYAALMLQSRAMLYAASIAKNGELASNSITGIPSNLANDYYQKSYNASKAIMDSGKFALINSSADKEKNYRSIFLTEGDANTETIFAEVWEPIIRGHGLDNLATPAGFTAVWSANFPVIYDFVELFDFTDGRSGKIDRSLFTNTNEWDVDDFFGKRDPRFRASVFYPESEYQGKRVWFHSRTIKADGTSVISKTTTFTRLDGLVMPEASESKNRDRTALLLRKRVNEASIQPIGNSSGQDYIIYRYGETLLNFAEAAFYLNKQNESLEAINDIRERAGMPLRTSITEQFIQQERQVELCFEDHRFWDLIRWRIAPQYLDGIKNKGLIFAYKAATDRYIITLKNAESYDRKFGPERYYLPFGNGRLADNPNLVQNPGY